MNVDKENRDGLIAVAQLRGYRKPEEWADAILARRNLRQIREPFLPGDAVRLLQDAGHFPRDSVFEVRNLDGGVGGKGFRVWMTCGAWFYDDKLAPVPPIEPYCRVKVGPLGTKGTAGMCGEVLRDMGDGLWDVRLDDGSRLPFSASEIFRIGPFFRAGDRVIHDNGGMVRKGTVESVAPGGNTRVMFDGDECLTVVHANAVKNLEHIDPEKVESAPATEAEAPEVPVPFFLKDDADIINAYRYIIEAIDNHEAFDHGDKLSIKSLAESHVGKISRNAFRRLTDG